jgi:hypothetical protein
VESKCLAVYQVKDLHLEEELSLVSLCQQWLEVRPMEVVRVEVNHDSNLKWKSMPTLWIPRLVH